jgi:hypothetical protein
MRKFRIGVALAALLIAGPVRAEIMDVREYWAMTCYPPAAAPYRVAFIQNTTLRVTSYRGVPHDYRIVGNERLSPGLVVTARDFRIGRTLTAGFSASRGFLVSEHGRDICSGDVEAGPTPNTGWPE